MMSVRGLWPLTGWIAAGAAAVGLVVACGSDDGGSAGEADAMVAMPDASMDQPDLNLFDMFVEPDMAVDPNPCIEDGGELLEILAGPGVEGLVDIRADVDANGDGQADLALVIDDPAGPRLAFLDARTGEPIGAIQGGAGNRLRLLNPVTPLPERPALLAPVPYEGGEAFFVLEGSDGEGGAWAVRAVSAADFSDLGRLDLPLPPLRVELVASPNGWRAAVRLSDLRCGVYAFGAAEPARAGEGFCDIRVGWDANNDGALDYLSWGSVSVNLIDGATLEDIARDGTPGLVMGFIPAADAPEGVSPGPANLRPNMGGELVSASVEGGQLQIRYHRPDLSEVGSAGAVAGDFTRVEFWLSADGLRVIAEEDGGGLKSVRVFQASDMRLRLAEEGFRNVSWDGDSDVDGDGFRELHLVHGPNADALSATQSWHALTNGDEVIVLEDERNAAFELIQNRAGRFASLSDLDTCDGEDRLVLRTGARGGTGNLPSRVLILDEDGRESFRGEPLSGRVHRMTLAELDGTPPIEVIEVTSDSETSATWRVLQWQPFR